MADLSVVHTQAEQEATGREASGEGSTAVERSASLESLPEQDTAADPVLAGYLQLPSAVGPLRRALQAPQHWPSALAALVGLPHDEGQGQQAADTEEAGSADTGVGTSLEARGSPPMSLSPCASVDSFSRGSFTTVSGPCTPAGARNCGDLQKLIYVEGILWVPAAAAVS